MADYFSLTVAGAVLPAALVDTTVKLTFFFACSAALSRSGPHPGFYLAD